MTNRKTRRLASLISRHEIYSDLAIYRRDQGRVESARSWAKLARHVFARCRVLRK